MINGARLAHSSLSPSLPSGEGSTNSLSSLLKKQNPHYMLIDIICTIVQWRISALFSKRVNAGVLWKRMLRLMMAWESLLSESQTSNLTQAQNELSAFTLIFFIILFVNMRYAPLSFSGIAAQIYHFSFSSPPLTRGGWVGSFFILH